MQKGHSEDLPQEIFSWWYTRWDNEQDFEDYLTHRHLSELLRTAFHTFVSRLLVHTPDS